MLKISFKIIAILVLVIFQLSLMTKFSIFDCIPNLILIFAITLVLRNHFNDAILVATTGGIIFDLTSTMRFGVYTFIFLAIILIIQFLLLNNIPSLNNFVVYLIFFTSFIFSDLIIFLVIRTWPSWNIFLSSLINGFWGIIIYFYLGPKIVSKEEIIMV